VAEVAESRSFVGRAAELAALDVALRHASAGQGGAVIVGGEAGIGKTHLVERFAGLAGAGGAVVLVGACLEFGESGLPYAPFVEALRALVRSVEPERLPALLGPGRAELARLLPELASRVAEPTIASELDRSAPARLFELVLGVLERLGRTQPLVLVVEDVQWADPSTRDLLAFLVRNLRRSRVLFVITARSEDLQRRGGVLPFLAELERHDHVDRLEVASLDRHQLGDQLAALAGGALEPEVVDRIFERSGGNPFYAEQLLAAEPSKGEPGELPPRLRDVLLARIGRLSEPARDVLRAAAAAGRRIDDRLLVAGLDLPERALHEGLREAVENDILVPVHGPDGDTAYAFRHALLQEVVYAELFTGERIRLHAAFGRSLQNRAGEGAAPSPAELAFHWDAAREPARALGPTIEAARAAEGVYAYAEAYRHYQRALELWERVPDPARAAGGDRAALMERAAEAAVMTGQYARAIELGRAALAAVDATADPLRAGLLHERLRWFLWEAGERHAAVASVREALRLIPPDPPTAGLARALAHLAAVELFASQFGPSREHAEGAVAAARAVGARSEEALALGILGWDVAVLGDVEAGVASFREGKRIAEELGSVEGQALAQANLAALLDRVGRTEESLAVAREGFEVVRSFGLERTYGGLLAGSAAKALISLGRWDEADVVTEEALERSPSGRAALWLLLNRGRLLATRGLFEEATRLLGEAREIEERLGGTEYRAALLAAIAELAVWQGRLADCRAAVAEGVRRADADASGPPDPSLAWLAALGLRAEADAAAGARARHDDAALADSRALCAAIAARVEGYGRGRMVLAGRTAALIALCRAELQRVEGKATGAEWAAVADEFAALDRPFPVAYARYRQAESILTTRGPRPIAQQSLREAHDVAVRLGAEPLRREVELLARQGRLELAAVPASRDAAQESRDANGGLGLTARESEVLQLVAGGWSNQQIADALFISRKTASVHVSNILGKLGVGSRIEAAAIAHRLGLAGDAPVPPDAAPR
jgi:DNA-binding CsgD family transcriptional regulator/tetratricopeptide (TPR) repeat protein